MPHIFISYESTARPQARLIANALAANGYDVWWDALVPAHRNYRDVIADHLRSAGAVVVLWSKAAVKSQWVAAEADVAREQGRLIQVRLDDVVLPLPFNNIQCAKLQGWSGDARSTDWLRVIASVSDLMGSPTRVPHVAASATPTQPLLAVLPFDNLSNDAELLYFSDGVSEEILQTVAKTTPLRTIGRSSSFQFRGADKAVRHVAAELNVTHVLDGSVRRSGGRVRISAQLIECVGQTTLWSERFDRDLSDVFALQDEIAAAVAAALKMTFAPSAQTGPIDPLAHDLYLQARAGENHLGGGQRHLLEAAVARAPGLVPAWSALALTYAIHGTSYYDWGFPDYPEPDDVLRGLTVDAAHKAIALAPDSGIAYVALSILEPICGRFVERDALIGKALAFSPDHPEVLMWANRWSRSVGRSRDALGYVARAREVDPLWAPGINQYAELLAETGNAVESAREFDRALTRWPESGFLMRNSLGTAASLGDWDRVARLIENCGLGSPRVDVAKVLPVLVQQRLQQIADLERRQRWTAEDSALLLDGLRRQLAETGTITLQLGWACHVGLTDAVYELVERASFDHLLRPGGRLAFQDYGLHWLFALSNRPLRRDPRFVRWCARLGLCDYWAKTDRWPDCVDEVARYYDFKREARSIEA